MATDFWFKFNFKDWANDVRPLSLTARGLLLEMIIYMRQAPVVGQMPNDIRLIVRLTGALTEEITESITEFKNFGILDFVKNDDGSETIISRRIVKEFERSRINAENGKNGGNPKLKKQSRLTESVNQNDNQTHNRTSNSISNSNFDSENENKKAWFEVFWETYDKKTLKPKAIDQWMKLSEKDMMSALDAVGAYVASKPDKQYRKDAFRWIRDKCWNDEIILPNQLKSKFEQTASVDLKSLITYDEPSNH